MFREKRKLCLFINTNMTYTNCAHANAILACTNCSLKCVRKHTFTYMTNVHANFQFSGADIKQDNIII